MVFQLIAGLPKSPFFVNFAAALLQRKALFHLQMSNTLPVC